MPIGIYKRKPFSEKHKREMSEAKKGKKLSEEVRKKISSTLKGIKLSEEHKKKISKTLKGKHTSFKTEFKKGEIGFWRKKKRLPFSDETKKKMSEAHKGEKSYLWKGGISYEPYTIDWTETLKRAIRERDHYLCQICSQYGDISHHIDYDKKNCNSDNLITLCKSCHCKTNHNRAYWINYFKGR